jgi:hypothetical protein
MCALAAAEWIDSTGASPGPSCIREFYTGVTLTLDRRHNDVIMTS